MKNTILDFENVCDDLINGKFIVPLTKLSQLLQISTNVPEINRIINHSLTDFDYKKELGDAINNPGSSSFLLPREDDKVIALVYSLLQDFCSDKIKVSQFTASYFGNTSTIDFNASFLRFTGDIILRYKLSVLNMLDEQKPTPIKLTPIEVAVNINKKVDAEAEVIDEPLSQKEIIISQLNTILDTVECDNRIRRDDKDEAIIMIQALSEALELESITIISALSIAFDNLAPRIKSIKHLYKKFKQDLLAYLD